jgi:lysophospholipase
MKSLDRFFEPEGWQLDSFTSTSGKNIRYGHADPKGDAKGTVVITTGYADFIEAYHETIHEYLDRGYAVWMMDWAGHGGSEKDAVAHGKKGQTVEDHIEDLRKFREEIVKPAAGKPVFLSTHSMGGQVALRFLGAHGGDFDFAILATPMVETRVKGPLREMLKFAFATAVAAGLGDETIPDGRRMITRGLTAERANLKEENPLRMSLHRTYMLLDDKLKAEEPSVGYVSSLFSSSDKTSDPAFLKAIKTPVLFGIGLSDDVIDNDAVRRAGKLMPNAVVREIDDGLHALWIDRDKQRRDWWSAIDAYISAQVPPAPHINALPPPPKGP